MKKWAKNGTGTYYRKDGPCHMFVWDKNGREWFYSVILNTDKNTFLRKIGSAKSLNAVKRAALKAAWELSWMLKEEVWLRAVKNAEGVDK